MKSELLYFISQCIIGTKCLCKISHYRVCNLLCAYEDHTLSGSYSTRIAESREYGYCCESQWLDTEALTRECPKLILWVPAVWGEQPSFSAESCNWSRPCVAQIQRREGNMHSLFGYIHFTLFWSGRMMLNASKLFGKEKLTGKNILYCVER